jgi:threonine synthase
MKTNQLKCLNCNFEQRIDKQEYFCTKCGGILDYITLTEHLKKIKLKGPITFWRYKPLLPPVSKTVTLGEGGTPLQKAERLSNEIGIKKIFLKNETQNPTNSYKDRSAALIISDAASRGYDNIISASTGNHGASLAAYAAKENINCNIIIPKTTDIGKLAQMMIYNAKIEEAGKSIEEAIKRSKKLEEEMGWYQATTELNPLSSEGLKTISYEIVEQNGVPDWLIVAMGSGVTSHALWKGFQEMQKMGMIDDLPKIIGVQAEGCAPIAQAYNLRKDYPIKIKKGFTEASAINNIEPIYGHLALNALKQSKGVAVTVTDQMMLNAGKEIARLEGIFAEPASSAPIASLRILIEEKYIEKDETIVCLITSSGLKTDDILKTLNKHKKSPKIGSKLTTKESILRLISQRRTYGYDIWKRLGSSMTLGAVYQHLNDLEKRGLISPEVIGKRKMFKITERGKRVLNALDELQLLL